MGYTAVLFTGTWSSERPFYLIGQGQLLTLENGYYKCIYIQSTIEVKERNILSKKERNITTRQNKSQLSLLQSINYFNLK